MKFCTHCGAELFDEAVLCPKCGCATSQLSVNRANGAPKWSICAVIGFVLSIASLLIFIDWLGILGFTGLIVSVFGCVNCHKNGLRGKKLAVTGVVVGAITALISLVLWIAVFATL